MEPKRKGEDKPVLPPDEAPAEPIPPIEPWMVKDGAWGQGAATALDNLRGNDFRGRRSRRTDDKPNSD
ncbi:MAG: hypothetical protein AVDCRST_MAG51-2925 [uncultured Ramlibacter sp.]|uniref:Uncharacterized protein n=1 Tax=uncultured Ramlibacter sp. TaxID=260755 RepID=A0A6J4QEQ0_9BURK|nr:MAG: hypothetical protein AVDCRST_MAG51-2925 [uncultured Ramlibacter sp.]